jgi:organic hydroperoxide reductase OsmC/OhrA
MKGYQSRLTIPVCCAFSHFHEKIEWIGTKNEAKSKDSQFALHVSLSECCDQKRKECNGEELLYCTYHTCYLYSSLRIFYHLHSFILNLSFNFIFVIGILLVQ